MRTLDAASENTDAPSHFDFDMRRRFDGDAGAPAHERRRITARGELEHLYFGAKLSRDDDLSLFALSAKDVWSRPVPS